MLRKSDVRIPPAAGRRSFAFELQRRCSAFTSRRARKRDPKTFSLAAHNQELVLGHVTFVLQQLFQISLERGLCFDHRIKRLMLEAAGQALGEISNKILDRVEGTVNKLESDLRRQFG